MGYVFCYHKFLSISLVSSINQVLHLVCHVFFFGRFLGHRFDNVLFAKPGISKFDWLTFNSEIRARLVFILLSY